MTAPSAGPRTGVGGRVPAGIKLDDGYQTIISFASNPTAKFFEKTVTPPGIDGGDAVENTTMHNEVWRTMAPRALKTLTEMQTTVAYDPDIYNECVDPSIPPDDSLINRKDTITVFFPDQSTLAFYGYLKSLVPDEISEGEQPTATMTIQPTNTDPTTGAEEGPVLTETPGT